MPYCTPAQLLERYDARVIGDCVSDDATGVRVDPTDLLTNPIVLSHLEQASGEIEVSLMQGGRYEVADLSGLTGGSLAFLVALCADLTFASLWRRRSWTADDDRGRVVAEAARAELERIRKGEHIFGIPKIVEAGLPATAGPSRVALRRLNMIVDRARPFFYPERRTPNNR